MGRHRKKRRGWFWWSCEGVLANHRFSRRGRIRHLCRDCIRLPKEELEYRQAARNIFRVVRCDMPIGRRKWRQIERFFEHPHPRVRELMARLKAESDAEIVRLREEERRFEEEAEAYERDLEAGAGEPRWTSWGEGEPGEIPF